jgi:tetratricopeptide (TPR) repeat protein
MKPNKKLLAVSIMALMIVGLTACGGPEDRAARYFEKGQELFEEGNYKKARLELKNALQVNGDLPEAWFLLGRMSEQEREWKSAFDLYSKVKELQPTHLEARVRRAKILLAAGNVEEAQEEADWALQQQPQHTGAKMLQSGIYLRKGDNDQAIVLAEQALATDVTNEVARQFLAQLLLMKDDPAEARALLEEGLRLNPESVDLRQSLVVLYRRQNDQEGEIRILRKLANLQPDMAERHHLLAEALHRNGQVDEAEQVLRTRMKQEQDQEERPTRLLLIDFLAQVRSAEAAENELKALIAADGDSNELKFRLARLYREQQRSEDAKKMYEGIIKKDSLSADGMQARKMLAGMHLVAGGVDEAKVLINEVLAENPKDGDALITRAAMALAEKDTDQAITDLRSVLQDRPGSIKATELIVKAFLLAGQNDLAVQQLERFTENNPDNEAGYIQLARLYVAEKNVANAERSLMRLLTEVPTSVAGRKALVELLLRTGQKEKAVEQAKMLIQPDAENADHLYFLGSVYQAIGDHQQAVAHFEQALEIAPDSIQPLSELVRSLVASEQEVKAVQKLEAIIKAKPKHFVAQNLRGELLLADGKLDEAAGFFQKAMEINGRWHVPYINLATAYEKQEQMDKAVSILQKGEQATAGNGMIFDRLINLLVRMGRADEAIARYEALLEKNPNQELLINNLAMLLIKHRDDEESRGRALELASRFENSANPRYRDTLGWIYYLKGETEQAIGHLEPAVAVAPESGELQYHLAMAYLKAGRETEAKIHLEKAVTARVAFSDIDKAKRALKKL